MASRAECVKGTAWELGWNPACVLVYAEAHRVGHLLYIPWTKGSHQT